MTANLDSLTWSQSVSACKFVRVKPVTRHLHDKAEGIEICTVL